MAHRDDQARPTGRAGAFDLRWIICALFAVYGVVLTILGIWFTTDTDYAKTGGLNINLWTGIGMLVVAGLFAVWAGTRPMVVPASSEPLPQPPP